MRQSAVTRRLLPTDEAVPCTITILAVMIPLHVAAVVEQGQRGD
jgi:hypothetical protein